MDNGASSYRRYLDGDDNGIAEIVAAYKDGLILYLNGYVENIHTAEELTEDTFFRLVAKKPWFSGRCSFKTWLYTVGRNVAMDHLRRRRRVSETPIEELENYLAEEADLERSCIREERNRELHRTMRKLNPDYRQVLHLVYFEGFDNREVAHILKKTERQVRNLLYRARQSLKTALEKEGFTYEEL